MGAPKYFLNKGEKYGRYTLIEKIPGAASWLCKCDCGNIRKVRQDSLAKGASKSCGCWGAEQLSKKMKKHGHATGYSPEYRAWHHMRERCYNTNNKRYEDYGGRGIRVCDRWLESFENFLLDMGLRPSKEHSLDRYPDNDGDYEPDNCRWGTRLQQMNGRRNTVFVEHEGEKYSITELAIKLGKSRDWVRARYIRKTGPINRKNIEAVIELINSGVNTTRDIKAAGLVKESILGFTLWKMKKKNMIFKSNNIWKINEILSNTKELDKNKGDY